MSLSKKKVLKGSLTRLVNRIERQPPVTAGDAHEFLPLFSKLYEDLQATVVEIMDNTQDPVEKDSYEKELHELLGKIEDEMFKLTNLIKVEKQKLVENTAAAAATAATSNVVSATTAVRLPDLKLPTFDGDRMQYMSFIRKFDAAIHGQSIANAAKLEYLVSCLNGRPAEIISHLSIEDINYEPARQILKDKYENKRKVVFELCKKMVDQQAVQGQGHLEELYDNTKAIYHALANQGHPVEKGDALFVYIMHQKLDYKTQQEYKAAIKSTVPTAVDFLEFLKNKCAMLDDMDTKPRHSKPAEPRQDRWHSSTQQNQQSPQQFYYPSNQVTQQFYCPACSEYHQAISCKKFMALSINEKWDTVRSQRLCFNCMRPDHSLNSCRSSGCKRCGARHNTLLHNDNQKNTEFLGHCATPTKSLLPTAVIRVRAPNGRYMEMRSLLDTGSTVNLITERAAKLLNLKINPIRQTLLGVGAETSVKGSAPVQVKTKEETEFIIDTVVVPSISNSIPTAPMDHQQIQEFNKLDLADPSFNRPGIIDMILSSNVVFRVLRPAMTIENNSGTAVAMGTAFGHIIASTSAEQAAAPNQHIFHTTIQDDFARLWDLENNQDLPRMSPEEEICEAHFTKNTKRLPNGAYQVSLPLSTSTEDFSGTKVLAIRRLTSLERKLSKDATMAKMYSDQFQQYLTLSHMEAAPIAAAPEKACYLPHHAVFKEDSTTTKLRIVFDGSTAFKGQRSLNQAMFTGPRVQEDILSIIIRFRKHAVALVADIEQMYRQIHLDPEQRDLHRVLWRNDPTEKITEFRMTRLTFGTRAAAYLAKRVLKELAIDEGRKFPDASLVLMHDFYVDDLMSGADGDEEATQLKLDLTSLLEAGGFNLRKWASNCTSLNEVTEPLNLKTEFVSTLGIHWYPAEDEFRFSVRPNSDFRLTKRSVLSTASQLFDPLNWLVPVTIYARIFIQHLWKQDIGWDEPLSGNDAREWMNYYQSLPELEKISVPRHIQYSANTEVAICGFADSSEKAYGAVVYLRCIHPDRITSEIVAAKARVAPVKSTSIPRLELAAAVLLTKLVKNVKESLKISNVDTYLFTDSTIVLAWIRQPSYKWQTFVANRVAEIQVSTTTEMWHKVDTKENPADYITRPLTPCELQQAKLWWHGPSWLKEDPLPLATTEIAEIELEICHFSTKKEFASDQYSSLSKMCRVWSYVRRVLRRRTFKKGAAEPVTPAEYEESLMWVVKEAQQHEFQSDIAKLRKNVDLGSSPLNQLNPFLDSEGILRVTGRIQKADIPYDQRHPIIIPKNLKLAELIIRHEHTRSHHGGVSLVQAATRNRWWILGGKRIVKKFIHKCIVCVTFKAHLAQQMMGNLPSCRTNPSRPFTEVAVDYAGPILIRPCLPRSKIRIKAYISVFVCMASKAIHLELVTALSTDAFMSALRRFVARRGLCRNIYSDNGTNFRGADNELKELLLADSFKLQECLTPQGITWHFQPPNAPHFGGIHEAGVKSVKHHLMRAAGSKIFTYEELSTLLTEIEACLNSRPLMPLSDDPNDVSALTPGHFLIGAALHSPPDVDLRNFNPGRLDSYQLVQQTLQKFWDRWSKEYLTTLQKRTKWNQIQANLRVDDMVIIKVQNQPPQQWPLGRVVETHPGQDQAVRVVTVRTATGLLRRPVTSIVLLPVED